MRLTIAMKEQLVALVMADVPAVDYRAPVESLVKSVALSLLPKEIQELPDDIRQRFVKRIFYALPSVKSICVPGDDITFSALLAKLNEDAKFCNLLKLKKEQENKLSALREEVKQAIFSCNTEKQLLERYPEFAKYLPTKNETTNLPTVPTIEHLKAAGWPKPGGGNG